MPGKRNVYSQQNTESTLSQILPTLTQHNSIQTLENTDKHLLLIIIWFISSGNTTRYKHTQFILYNIILEEICTELVALYEGLYCYAPYEGTGINKLNLLL